jgi:hypothetical protein
VSPRIALELDKKLRLLRLRLAFESMVDAIDQGMQKDFPQRLVKLRIPHEDVFIHTDAMQGNPMFGTMFLNQRPLLSQDLQKAGSMKHLLLTSGRKLDKGLHGRQKIFDIDILAAEICSHKS